MTRTTERTLIFLLFLILTIASAVLEVWIIIKVVETGDISFLKGIFTVVNTGFLAIFIRYFAKLVNKMFLQNDLVSEEDLKKYFRNKLQQITAHGNVNKNDQQQFLKDLVGEILVMIEEILQNWVGPYQYEISIFSNRDNPEIIAYYETGGQRTPRSKVARNSDPDYYRSKGYKVVELLEKPTHEVIVISATETPTTNYKFMNEEQRKKIKSTLLHCFCVESPRVIVVVCDRPEVLKASDQRLKSLINAVGMAMQCEYKLDNYVFDMNA